MSENLTQKRQHLFQKLTKAQQQKLSLQERIEYLKAEQAHVQEVAKQKQNELKLKERKLLNEAKSQERKNETRRKILLGAWVLNRLQKDPNFKNELLDFRRFLENETKTEANKIKDVELFKDIL